MKLLHNNIELLSPVGSWEALVAAVQNGADAVYLGGKQYNARQYADNFDIQQLKKAVDYCHLRGVSVYLTLNTLLNDREIEGLYKYIVDIYNMGMDAVIVQDVGVAKLIHALAPELELHASTQMTVYNLEGVETLKKLGFSRVVLARELSLDQIEYICRNTELEIEVFVHGALCMCYSGQCLMSSIIGGRSGNRGCCAQPCRLSYELIDFSGGSRVYKGSKGKYLLSPKDLSLIDYLPQLGKAGVKSLKIEGRMKRPEYVAVVTKIFRKYLDNNIKIDKTDYKKLLQMFNRGGFTQGYIKSEVGPDMMSLERPNNWGVYIGKVLSYKKSGRTATVKLSERLNVGDGIEVWTSEGESYGTIINRILINNKEVPSAFENDIVNIDMKGEISAGDKIYKTSDIQLNNEVRPSFQPDASIRKVPVYANCTIKLGKPMRIRLWDEQGNFVEHAGSVIAEKAINKPLDKEKVQEQLMKMGGTPYYLAGAELDIEKGLSLPISEINGVRRSAVEKLNEKRLSIYKRPHLKIDKVKKANERLFLRNEKAGLKKRVCISVQVNEYKQAVKLLECEFDRLYIPAGLLKDNRQNEDIDELIRLYKQKGIQVVCVLPRIILKPQEKVYKDITEKLDSIGVHTILTGNIGLISGFQDKYDLIGDYSLNVFNSMASEFYKELGIKSITLSPELNFKQIRDLYKMQEMQYEIIAYGRLPLMITENCAIKNASYAAGVKHVCRCDGISFGLRDRKGAVFPILKDKLSCRNEILNSQIIFLADNINDIIITGVDYIRLMYTVESPDRCKEITELYHCALNYGQDKAIKKYESLVNEIEREGYTRGHYYRGV